MISKYKNNLKIVEELFFLRLLLEILQVVFLSLLLHLLKRKYTELENIFAKKIS